MVPTMVVNAPLIVMVSPESVQAMDGIERVSIQDEI